MQHCLALSRTVRRVETKLNRAFTFLGLPPWYYQFMHAVVGLLIWLRIMLMRFMAADPSQNGALLVFLLPTLHGAGL